MRHLPSRCAVLLPTLLIAGLSGASGGDAGTVRRTGAATVAATANPTAGRAFVMSGATGQRILELAPPAADESDAARFGHAVAGLGDTNGDGTPDLAVGAPGVREGSLRRVGRVYIFSGDDGTILQTIVSPSLQEGTRFGFSLAATGDLDGDGDGDLVAGAPRARTPGRGRTGMAWVLSGASGAPIAALADPGLSRGAYLGWSVASGRDVTGDGKADILVGAPGLDVQGRTDQGRAYLFDVADPNNPVRTVIEDPQRQSVALFGRAVAFMGDADGDAVPEIVVSADGQDAFSGDYAGRVFVISGADPNTDPNGGNVLQSRISPEIQQYVNFGFTVAGLDDVNNDGAADFAAAAPEQYVDGYELAGAAWVLGGDPNAPSAVVATLADPNTRHRLTFFGGSMAAVGDLSNDALEEVAVGSELHRDPNGIRTGLVFVYEATNGNLHLTLGSPTGDVCARFGWAVAPAGDVDGDGVPDIIVGAPFHRRTSRPVKKSCF